jgi:hypothetical protein
MQRRKVLSKTHIAKVSTILGVTPFFFTNTSSQSLGCSITADGIMLATGFGEGQVISPYPLNDITQ